MIDALSALQSLERPALLVRTAQAVAKDYKRETQLKRLLKQAHLPGPAEAGLRLMGLEHELEEARRGKSAAYRPSKHILVLAAIMCEAQMLRARQTDAQAKASGTSDFLRAI